MHYDHMHYENINCTTLNRPNKVIFLWRVINSAHHTKAKENLCCSITQGMAKGLKKCSDLTHVLEIESFVTFHGHGMSIVVPQLLVQLLQSLLKNAKVIQAFTLPL